MNQIQLALLDEACMKCAVIIHRTMKLMKPPDLLCKQMLQQEIEATINRYVRGLENG